MNTGKDPCGQTDILTNLKLPLDETGRNLKDKTQILKIMFKILHNRKALPYRLVHEECVFF